MFTGIIQAVGTVASKGRTGLSIKAALRARPGDSVAVNGTCLTVTRPPTGGRFNFDVSDETWRLTNLGALAKGERVNLEPALKAGDALGGHLVSGHVDARGRILEFETLPNGFKRLRVELPAALKGLVALKGSVAIDGISLTVTRVGPKWFETVLVPHTLSHTNLGRRETGQLVNLEADLIARYVRAALGK
jgi:riboflavin synthase alpha subunit